MAKAPKPKRSVVPKYSPATFHPVDVPVNQLTTYQKFYKACMEDNLVVVEQMADSLNLNVRVRETNKEITYLPLFHFAINNGIDNSFSLRILQFFITHPQVNINGHASFHNALYHWGHQPFKEYNLEVLKAFITSPKFDPKEFVYDKNHEKESVLFSLLTVLNAELRHLEKKNLHEFINTTKDTMMPILIALIKHPNFTDALLTSKEIHIAVEMPERAQLIAIFFARFPEKTVNLLEGIKNQQMLLRSGANVINGLLEICEKNENPNGKKAPSPEKQKSTGHQFSQPQ